MLQLSDLIGRKLGEYEVTRRIGEGGMGAVYEGVQPVIGKRVALKVLLPQFSHDAQLVERFLAEARAVNEIRHRGIVDIFGFGQLPEGSHYFVMEYLEGEGFDRIISTRAPVPLADAITWTCEVLDALGAAHAAGIIHRDIKPSNLFLVNTGRGKPYVKVLDFGIAKLGAMRGEATPQTRASVIMGTPDYISPEQVRGKGISPQTDLYAVGCVLFELTTGRRVFDGASPLAAMWSHVEDAPVLPSSIVPSIPAELDELVLWALEKDATKRPASAQVMAEHLEALRATVPTGPLTPLPMPRADARSGHTPPPSVRQRVLAATPAPTLAGRAYPSPRTPAQATEAPAPVGPDPGSETRAAPMTSPSNLPVATGDGGSTLVEGAPLEPRPSKARAPMIIVACLLVGLVGAIGANVMLSREPALAPVVAPLPVAQPPPEVAPPTTTVAPQTVQAPAPVEPTPVVVKPEPPVEPPKAPAPMKRGPSAAQLEARLAKLEQKLQAREAQLGEKDKVLRQLFDQARKELAAATTDAQRRDAWSTLNDVAAQFPR